MLKAIEADDYVVNQLRKIAEIAGDLKQILDIQAETEELSREESQASKVAGLIYDLSIHADAMKNSPSNRVHMSDPAYLEGDKPGMIYKYPLINKFDIEKYIKK